MQNLIYFSFMAINILGLILVIYDKNQARKGNWRVPESRFFVVALVGGATGVFVGMKLVRHKTRHRLFTLGIPVMAVLNYAFIYIYL